MAVAAFLALTLGTVAVRRFDAIVSLSLCVFLDGCLRRRPVLSGLALGVGVVTKLVPLLVVPVALVYWGALRRWRQLGADGARRRSGLAGGRRSPTSRSPERTSSICCATTRTGRWRSRAPGPRCSPSGAPSIRRRPGGSPPTARTTWWGPADRFLLPLAGIAPLLAIAGILAWSVVQHPPRAPARGRRAARRRGPGARGLRDVRGEHDPRQGVQRAVPRLAPARGALVSVLDTGRRRRIALWLLGGAMLLTQLNQHLFFGILGSGPHPLMGALFLLRNGLLMSWAVWTLVPGPARTAFRRGSRPASDEFPRAAESISRPFADGEPPTMSRLRVQSFGISLDGFGAGPDQSLEHPLGVGGEALHELGLPDPHLPAHVRHRTAARPASTTTSPRAASRTSAPGSSAATCSGPMRGPWPDESWKGWWGDEPPYHVPVFVLTHHARAPLEMKGGTTFHFVTGGIHDGARAGAAKAAHGKDVRVGGGVATIRQYLRAGLDRRDAPRDLAGAARQRRAPPGRHRPARARVPADREQARLGQGAARRPATRSL